MRTLTLSIAFLLLIAACDKGNSADVNQQSIYTIYELNYSESDNVTAARASFRLGGELGTKLELSGPAYCSFNSDTLPFKPLMGWHSIEYGGMIQDGDMEYRDRDNQVYLNSVGPITVVSFPVIDSISVSSDFMFIWGGPSVGPNETVSLTVSSLSNSGDEIFTTISEGDTLLVLSSAKLDNMGNGWKTCRLRRSFNTNELTEGTTKGGRISYSYEATKSIYLKP